jgi:hypothetical protein
MVDDDCGQNSCRARATGARLARLGFFATTMAAAMTALVGEARASDPFEIQVYDGTANPPRVFGVENHVNYWATGWRVSTPPEVPLHGQFHETLELSWGLTPFWEIGGYLQFADRTDDGVFDWAGVKLRSKFVTPDGWNPHWRFGINLEVAYLPSQYDASQWGSEVRPIAAWHDAHWLFAVNPIFDQSLGPPGASLGPSFQPCAKVARTVGPVALGIEWYATFGPGIAFVPYAEQEQQIFEVVDLLSVDRLELNVGVGEGITQASEGIVLKAILGYTFEPPVRERTTQGAEAASKWGGEDFPALQPWRTAR